jgi:hypothetical protein
MTSAIHKTKFLIATLTIGVVTVIAGSAVAVAVVNPDAARSTAHGEAFHIKSQLDQNFCITVAPGGPRAAH